MARRRFRRRRRRGGYIGVRRRRVRAGPRQVSYTLRDGTTYSDNYNHVSYVSPYPKSLNYNPQFLKVKRQFQYSGPLGDPIAGGVNTWKINDFSCVSNTVSRQSTFTQIYMTFKISDVPQITEFGALFDQYRIVGIKLTFKYMNSTDVTTSYAVSGSQGLCHLALTTDFDDLTANYPAQIGGWQQITESGRAKLATFPNQRGNKMSLYFKPRNQIKVLDVIGGTAAVETAAKRWLDGATAQDALYYGVTGLMYANPTDTYTINHTIRVYATYYTQWRNRK